MVLQAVIETPAFLRDAAAAGMAEAERAALVDFLARNPEAGDVIPGTGGARKLRWRRPGTGKSGGYRAVTFFSGAAVPVFLVAVFTKGERVDLSQRERNALAEMTKELVRSVRRRAGMEGAGR